MPPTAKNTSSITPEPANGASPQPTTTEEHHTIPAADGTALKVTTLTTTKEGHKPKVKVFLEPDELVKDQVGGFLNFLREHAIVGLAVGFIIGQQAQTVVKQLVDSVVTPTLSFFIGQDLAKKQVSLHSPSGQAVHYTWGSLLYVLINFLCVLIFIYAIIKIFNLDELDKKKA